MSEIKSGLKSVLVYEIIIVVLALIYSFIRYSVNYFRIPDSEIIYLLNKGLAFTASAAISLSYILVNLAKSGKIDKNKIEGKPKYFGVSGFLMASLHIIVSLMLLSKERFPYLYFENSTFNFTGEMTIFFGVLSLSFFIMPAITSLGSIKNAMPHKSWKNYQQIGYLGAFTIMIHVFFVDSVNLFNPQDWRFFLFPLSAISLLLLITALTMKIYQLVKTIVSWFRT